MLCPHCLNPLKLLKNPLSAIGCSRCGGKWLSFKVFQDRVGNDKEFQDLLYVAHQATEKGKTCPSCKKSMKPLRTSQNRTPLDVCFPCQHIWFDFAEYENFKGKGESLGEAFKQMRRQAGPADVNGIQVEAFQLDYWESFVDPRFQESPVINKKIIKGFPVISYALILICLLVFLKFRNDIPALWDHYAFHVGETPLANLKKLFTSFFVHANWGHLIGNLYFLFLISGEAEDVSTPLEFLTVMVGGHVLGTVLQGFSSAPGTFIGGASAGVFSLLVYYSILFPKARVQGILGMPRRNFNFTSTYLRWSMPIQLFVVIKLLVEIGNLAATNSGIAHLAHLGGAAVGAVTALTRKDKV